MRREKRVLVAIVIASTLLVSILGYMYLTEIGQRETVYVGTTTSLYDTGLLDVLKEEYEADHPGTNIAFISAGTGIALEHGKNGDVDVLLVHSPALEYQFMEEGFGVNRKIFAYNFFVIVGPPEDPAGINGTGPTEALQTLLEYGRSTGGPIWVSRDDRSGTNQKEIALWGEAGFDYDTIKQEGWFLSSGSGMGATLQVADERGLYTLSDIGTYLKYRADGLIGLERLVENDETLINVYSAIAVNNTRVSHVNFQGAMQFIQFMVSQRVQEIIAEYGADTLGRPLFNPAVDVLRTGQPADVAGWIRSYAYFDVGGTLYECPPQWRIGEYGLYS